ncbi:MAG: autotransporter outer membrane beta-barrel domain-containing protein, partial [Planctomycetota bacterium]|nr:autotransporter outer membrane beta-barrel domain-containing protein [Planctomycetota bacterium]
FNEAMTRRCQESRIPLGSLGNAPAGPHGPAAAAAPAGKNGIGVWVQGMALWADQDNMDQQGETKYGYQSDIYGFVGGLDKAVDRWVFGIALGGSWGDIEVNDLAASTDMYNFQIGPYFSFNEKKFFVDGGVSYGATYMDAKREITALNLVAESRPEADTWSAFVDAGYNFTFGKLTLTPIASLAYTCTSVEAYDETGAPGANLSVDETDLDTCIMRLGIRPAVALTDRIVVNAVATWNHDFCHERPTMHARFGPGNEFEIEGLRPDDDTYTLGLGCVGQLNDIASVFANYEYTGGDEYDGHNLMLGFRFDF